MASCCDCRMPPSLTLWYHLVVFDTWKVKCMNLASIPPLLFVTCADHQHSSSILVAQLTFSSPPSPPSRLPLSLLSRSLHRNGAFKAWISAASSFDAEEVNQSRQDLTLSSLSFFFVFCVCVCVSWLKFPTVHNKSRVTLVNEEISGKY